MKQRASSSDFINALRHAIGKAPIPSCKKGTNSTRKRRAEPPPCVWGALARDDGNRRRRARPLFG